MVRNEALDTVLDHLLNRNLGEAIVAMDNFLAVHPHQINTDRLFAIKTDYQLMVGAMEEGEIACSVWRKIAEYADGSATSKWVNLPVESYNRYFLPATDSYSLVYFHDYILAISSNDIYASRDGGIVWRTSEFQLPKDGDNFFYHVEAVTDDEGALWFKDLDTNNVWRGVLVE